MFVKEINEIKKLLEHMRSAGLIKEWSLPYESLFTRLNTAVFYVAPADHSVESQIWLELNKYDHFSFRLNTDFRISSLKYRVTFSEEERKKNLRLDE